jgi:carbonic anhydrase
MTTPDQALARLIEGNRRFVADQPAQPDISTQRRLQLAKGQQPFAALVGCADSRVGPEHLFGAGLGELFIVRTAGNYLDDAGFGSIAFAVAQLGVSLVVVLGHEQCGAVAAANAVVTDNVQLPPALSRMVQPILPAAIDAKAQLGEGEDLLDLAVHLNVRRVVRGLREASDPIIGTPVREGQVRVVGAYYDLATGAVDFFDKG